MLEIRSGIPLISAHFFKYKIYSIWWFMREYDSLANLHGNRVQWSSLVWSGLSSWMIVHLCAREPNRHSIVDEFIFFSECTYNFRSTQSNSGAITVISLILWKLLNEISDAFNFPLGMCSCTCFTHVMTLYVYRGYVRIGIWIHWISHREHVEWVASYLFYLLA